MALHPRNTVNIISLCSGGGGLDFSVELALPAARSVCLVEREAFAVARLVDAMQQGLMAPAAVWSDARTFDGRLWRGAVDGVIGGIPCQPHSVAGKRLGRDDERDLWPTARRIFVQSGAWFILIENVPGMLTTGGAERVWRDLRRLGCAVEIGLFSAAEVGASHERERLFILGVADHADRRRSYGDLAEQCEQPARAHRGRGRELAYANGQRSQGQRPDADALGRQDARGSAGLCGRATVDDSICRRRPARRNDHGSHDGHQPDPAGQHAVVDAARIGRGEGWAEHGLRSGRDTTAIAGRPVGDTLRPGSHAATLGGVCNCEESPRSRDENPERSGGAVGHPIGRGHDGRADDAVGRAVGRTAAEGAGERPCGCSADPGAAVADANLPDPPYLFPPGPGDLEAWRGIAEHAPDRLPALSRHDLFRLAIRAALIAAHGDPVAREGLDPDGPFGLRASLVQAIAQSCLRGRSDGLASRVDELRMLGNGVVPLEGAHAFRALVARLAARGSAGAAFLERGMVT